MHNFNVIKSIVYSYNRWFRNSLNCPKAADFPKYLIIKCWFVLYYDTDMQQNTVHLHVITRYTWRLGSMNNYQLLHMRQLHFIVEVILIPHLTIWWSIAISKTCDVRNDFGPPKIWFILNYKHREFKWKLWNCVSDSLYIIATKIYFWYDIFGELFVV